MAVDLDLREKGAVRNGERTVSDARLFMQLLAYGECQDTTPVMQALAQARMEGVLYEDLNDPRGVAILIWNRDPNFFIATARPLLLRPPFAGLIPKLEYSMFGRTYAIGHEPNLDAWLFEKPRQTALNPSWPWAIWYPLRRMGAFSGLAPEEMGRVLSEHGKIGHSFGEADYAHDIRLACFGLDKNDNDFVIGLVGRELFPLSACVQAMRKTQQTSQYIQNMGPFFVGKAVWQSPLPEGPKEL
jgi:hypothetical protein